ncbi:MAG TPA: sulfatase-like hydrolase/transferase, partial [Tepidisphaeraceae bacterium]|nr:sulfatase-like hydrolase/transferase [Tepidisphaeraceae bacterium]
MPTTQVPTLAANLPQLDADFSAAPPRRYFVFWPCFWLAVMLCATKAMHPGDPSAEGELASKEWLFDYLIFIHADLIFVLVIGVIWQILLALFARRAKLAQVVWRAGLIVFVGCALYAVISVPVFENLGTPLTYPLLHVAGNVGNMRSSLAAYMTFKLVAAIVVVPIGFALLVWCCNRVVPMRRALIRRSVIALCTAAIVTNGIYAHREYEVWSSRDDRAIADNPHWVLLSTTCKEFVQSDVATLHEDYPPEFAREFAPPPARLASAKLPGVQMNVIVVVLESVAAKYLSVYGAPYEATPQLHAEASNSLIVENVHSHVGMTANSLVSMLLGVYPPITWRQLTRDRPDYPGTSLAQVMHDAGYRTAYITSADIGYVSTDKFLKNRGFDVIDDVNSMGAPYSFSWGTEDRYMIDGLLRFIDADHTRPFFA